MYNIKSLCIAFALAAAVVAKDGSDGKDDGSHSSGSSGGPGKTIVITAGQKGLTFSPDTSTASIGDTLEFHFVGTFHTAVQGDFNTPCSMGSLSSTGFDSGSVTSVCPLSTPLYLSV